MIFINIQNCDIWLLATIKSYYKVSISNAHNFCFHENRVNIMFYIFYLRSDLNVYKLSSIG